METALFPIAKKGFEGLQRFGKFGRTITLKAKYADFSQVTRSKTLNDAVLSFELLWQTTLELLPLLIVPQLGVRLLGVSVSNFLTEEQEAVQLEIQWDDF